jgi:hypothetical protein
LSRVTTGRTEASQIVAPRNSLLFASTGPTQTSSELSLDEDPANAVRVKGINFLSCLDAIQRLYGPLARVRIEKETPGEVGNALKFGGIVIGGWYKASWYRAFWRSVAKELDLDELGARRLGHKATSLGVNGAYRALARMTSPEMLLTMATRAFGFFFDRGQLLVKQTEPQHLTAEFTQCVGFDPLIWNEVLGGAIYFVETAGASQVDVTIAGGGGNAAWMLVHAKYS